MANDQNGGERRAVQRDWVGHSIQLAAIFVGIGVPLMIWANSINSTIAKVEDRIIRQDRDAAEVRSFQMQTTTQMLDINRQLATIVERVSSIRENTSKRR